MERENQLELLQKLVQAHVKNQLYFQMVKTRNDLIARGLDSLSQCLSEKVKPDVLIRKIEQEAQHKINEYCRIWSKRIVEDYEQKLKE